MNKLVPNFPTLIVCGFVVIAAILSFFAGVLLQTMKQKNLSDFEMRLIEIESRKKQNENHFDKLNP